MAEYAVILALIAIVAISGLTLLGGTVASTLSTVGARVGIGGGGGGGGPADPPAAAWITPLGVLPGGNYSLGQFILGGRYVVGSSNAPGGWGRSFGYDIASPSPAIFDLGRVDSGLSCYAGEDGNYSLSTAGDTSAVVSVSGVGTMCFAVYDFAAGSPHLVGVDPPSGFGDITGNGISNHVVVGTYWGISDGDHAFAYNMAAGSPSVIDLGDLGAVEFSRAMAIDAGLIGGYADNGSGSNHAFAYDLAAGSPHMIDLGTLPGDTSSAVCGVSGRVLLGLSTSAAGIDRVFAYDMADGSPHMTDLGNLGGGSYPPGKCAVRDGVLYGTLGTPAGKHVFAYDPASGGSSVIDLTPSATDAEAYGFGGNNAVGGTNDVNPDGEGFYVDYTAGFPAMVSLGFLPGDAGSDADGASGVYITGESYNSDWSHEEAVLWNTSAPHP
jgi:hypothetical protein